MDELSKKCFEALDLTKKTIFEIGEYGRSPVKTKKTEPVTKSDLEISKALKNYFLNSGLNAVYCSEEAGRINSIKNPDYIIFWDELDGTFNWQKGGLLSSAAVISAFEYRRDLKFRNALFAGILELNSGNLWYAERGKGAFFNKERINQNKNRETELGNQVKVMLDLGPCPPGKLHEKFLKIYSSTWVGNISCAGIHLAGVASGHFDAAVLPLQKAHELGAGYLLIKESGKYLSDFNGKILDNQKFNFDSKYQIIASATKELGKKLLEKILS